MKYRLFVDESGDPSLSSVNADFPVFVLLGCLFEDSAYQDICTEITELKKEFFGSEHAILHSRDIRKCEGVFVKLFDLNVKEKFYKKLNSILENGNYIVISVGINKKEFIEKYGKIADLCAYPVARHIINPKEPYPAYDIVEKKFRKNSSGSFVGYGLKIFP